MAQKTHKAPFIPRSSGERVAHARRLLGVREGQDILPPDLATRVGVTINSVYAWETGTVPGPKNLKRLADELGVTPEWIHYGAGAGPTAGQSGARAEKPLATYQVPDTLASALAGEPPADQEPATKPAERPRAKSAKGKR